MSQNSIDTWVDLKKHYFDNLNELHDAINKVQNSSLELTRVYSEIIKKSKDSSPETVRKFVHLWMKKIDPDDVELMPLLKEEYNEIQSNPSEANLEYLGSKIQQKLHRESILKLDAYDGIVRAFYDTWDETWPKNS